MRAVVFDWDLTLWDSWGIHLRLMENTAADLGVAAPSAEAVAAEFHRPFRQHLVWFFGSRPDADHEADAILDAYLTHYYRIAGHRNYLYPGAASLLRALRRRNIRIGILSDKQTRFGLPELEQSGLVGLVDCANFKTDARPYKPAPDGLQTVLAELGATQEETLYVGDGPQDMACAHAIGVTAAAAMWATIDREAILAQQPAYRLHRPHQVMAVVAEANGYVGSDAWVRHLPWPWRPDADNPADDQDVAATEPSHAIYAEPEPAAAQSWPMAGVWQGRTSELALPPHAANPVAPLALWTPPANGKSRISDSKAY